MKFIGGVMCSERVFPPRRVLGPAPAPVLAVVVLAVLLLTLSGCAGFDIFSPKKPIPTGRDAKPSAKKTASAPAQGQPAQETAGSGEEARPAGEPAPAPSSAGTAPPSGSSAQGAPATPRAQASLSLTQAGRQALERGQPDQAIRLLERAAGLNPANGENYFWLAEAWLKKGNLGQAKEYNRLAARYLGRNPDWSGQVKLQAQRIKAAGS